MISKPRLQAVAAAGLAASFAISCSSTEDSRTEEGSSASPAGPPPSSAPSGTYRDGTYSADGWYGGQPSRIGVRLTLAGGAIGSVTITTYATDPTSLGFQRDFAAAVPDAVVGKPIDQADVDRLAGASGTSEGWNSALDLIREQAAR